MPLLASFMAELSTFMTSNEIKCVLDSILLQITFMAKDDAIVNF